jgi:hypothetical protein
MSADDAVDGASSAASKCYSSCVESESNKGGQATVNVETGALKELARTRRRNADKVDPGIGRTRLGHRTSKVRANDWDPIRAEHYGQRLHRLSGQSRHAARAGSVSSVRQELAAGMNILNPR